MTSKPIFEAGTEKFIRDWRNTIITVTVRDQRMREHDPIVGVVPLKLSQIFQTSSQVTRWFPLDAGLVGDPNSYSYSNDRRVLDDVESQYYFAA